MFLCVKNYSHRLKKLELNILTQSNHYHCHPEERGISASSSAKNVGNLCGASSVIYFACSLSLGSHFDRNSKTLSSYLRRSLVPRDDKLNENTVMKMIALALIKVKILLCRSPRLLEPQKIGTHCFASSHFQARVRD